MKLLLFLALIVLAVPAQAQRVFRASSIDLEQNDRLDTLEAKVSSIEASLSTLASAIKAEPATPAPAPVAPTPVVPAPALTVQPAAYSVGDDIVTSNGATHTVTKVTQENGRYLYHTAPKTLSTYTLPQRPTTGYYDGTSQWTYPGDIRSHLQGTHGVSTAGMTKDQMEAMHDSLHNASRGRSVSRTVTRSVQSACPGGVCPSPARRSLFGWR